MYLGFVRHWDPVASQYCIKIVQKPTSSEGEYFCENKYRNLYNYEDPKILIEVLGTDNASTLL